VLLAHSFAARTWQECAGLDGRDHKGHMRTAKSRDISQHVSGDGQPSKWKDVRVPNQQMTGTQRPKHLGHIHLGQIPPSKPGKPPPNHSPKEIEALLEPL